MVLKKKYILYFVEYFSALFIVYSYESSKYLALLTALACVVYCIWEKDDAKVVMLMLFLLPFSGVFKLSFNSTSLYMLLRIACIARCFYKYRSIRRDFMISLGIFILYIAALTLFHGRFGVMRIFNLALWFLLAYSFVLFSTPESQGAMARAFSQGTILSCVFGANLGLFPHLQSLMAVQSYKSSETGEMLSRFTGLWNDPNALTVMLVSACCLCFLAMRSRRMPVPEFLVSCIVLTLFGLMTMSKSCILLMAVFWAYIFLKRTQLKTSYKVAMLTLVAVVFVLIYDQMESLIMEILARFTEAEDVSDLTTGRTDLWSMYLEDMTLSTWIFGNGLDCTLPAGRAAHNTILQIVYNVGIIGGILWFMVFYFLNRTINARQPGYPRIYLPILMILVTMLFLDGFLLEYYYLLIITMLIFSRDFAGKAPTWR